MANILYPKNDEKFDFINKNKSVKLGNDHPIFGIKLALSNQLCSALEEDFNGCC